MIHSVKIGKYKQPVLYETVAGLSFNCGCIVHNTKNCPNNSSVNMDPNDFARKNENYNHFAGDSPMVHDERPKEKEVAGEEQPQQDENGGRYGPWMVVNRRRQRAPPKKQQPETGPSSSNSRSKQGASGPTVRQTKGNLSQPNKPHPVTVVNKPNSQGPRIHKSQQNSALF